MHRPQWQVHAELLPADPRAIHAVCAKAGKDGWELTGMLPMLVTVDSPPILLPGGANNRLEAAMQAQTQAAARPQPGVLLMFKRLAEIGAGGNGEVQKPGGEPAAAGA